MSYLEKVQQCNNLRVDNFTPLFVSDKRIGWIQKNFEGHLKQFSDVFEFGNQSIRLNPTLSSLPARSAAVQNVVDTLILDGLISRQYGEVYPVTSQQKNKPEFLIDRAVASWFGTRTFGQHLNGYVYRDQKILMWIARRAMDRGYEPGKLDQIVAGGFPHDISARDNMRKECMEEAGMSVALADKARPVGTITCCYENAIGVKPETLYCYDLELSIDFEPECTDGEVDKFMLLPIDEVAELVRDTDSFKLNCNLVVIDFLIRHGFIQPEDQDYDLLVKGLHQ